MAAFVARTSLTTDGERIQSPRMAEVLIVVVDVVLAMAAFHFLHNIS
jgi:hypothetical protein